MGYSLQYGCACLRLNYRQTCWLPAEMEKDFSQLRDILETRLDNFGNTVGKKYVQEQKSTNAQVSVLETKAIDYETASVDLHHQMIKNENENENEKKCTTLKTGPGKFSRGGGEQKCPIIVTGMAT